VKTIGLNGKLCEKTTTPSERGHTNCAVMECMACNYTSPPWWNISMAEKCCPECKSRNIRITPHSKPYKLPLVSYRSTTIKITTQNGIIYTNEEDD